MTSLHLCAYCKAPLPPPPPEVGANICCGQCATDEGRRAKFLFAGVKEKATEMAAAWAEWLKTGPRYDYPSNALMNAMDGVLKACGVELPEGE